MRIASFNVENLFARPKAMADSEGDAATRKKVLAAHARLSDLFERHSYAGAEDDILALLDTVGVLRSDEGPYVRLRKLRGQLVRRPRTGEVTLVAKGRADWVGWLELKTIAVNALATENTARVFEALDADVVTVVEADDRPGLQMFSESLLPAVGGTPYEQVMVLEGNDLRGIDVGLMASGDYRLVQMRTHIFDTDPQGTVFSRDCCEYHVETPLGTRLVLLANHFKSKGYSSPGDPTGAKRRERQASRVARIVRSLRSEGVDHLAVTGDLNDDPDSTSLAPLLEMDGLTDVSAHPAFDWNHRRGTYGSGNEDDKIDYILLSDPLFARMTAGGVFRKGVWRGPRTKDPWEIFPTLTSRVEEASDHAALWADLAGV
ncbi:MULTISPECIES: endonuclease/exonuclease/phosphatase family protein [Mumia]|uniref:endonuclease/exonuclease/phosphatase family protein n=1 Tax=Mumia TaxID=1546255 RepID=UPI0014228981|nr:MULTISPECIES: endonuclease/exonuclease/phosphatase family protein [unclassified Mumia]QMW65468.1 endonuclease/exonuclease/phosphatase family protein [Mumia sp. ZJ1417]